MKEKTRICRIWEIAVFLFTPFTAFYLMQFILGGWPWEYSPGTVLGNGLCIGALYWVLCALSGRPVICGLAVHGLAGLWGAANYFVAEFRGNPILPWDFTALGTAAAVSGTYRLRITGRMGAAILAAAGAGAAGFLMRKNWRPLRFRGRAAAVLLSLICLSQIWHPGKLEKFGVEADVWDQAGAYRKNGAVGAFLCNLEFLNVDVPDGYSRERA